MHHVVHPSHSYVHCRGLHPVPDQRTAHVITRGRLDRRPPPHATHAACLQQSGCDQADRRSLCAEDDVSIHMVEAPPGGTAARSAKAPKKRQKRPRPVPANAAAATTGNQEEAASMRTRLGITAADPTSASTQVPFSFGFSAQAHPDEPADSSRPANDTNATGSLHGSTRIAGAAAAADSAGAGDAAEMSTPVDAAAVGTGHTIVGEQLEAEPVKASKKRKRDKHVHSTPSPADAAPDAALPGPPETLYTRSQEGATCGALGQAHSTEAARPQRHEGPAPAHSIGNKENVDADGYVPRRVYVGGLPYWYDEATLRQCWAECGAIASLTMLTFPDSGRFRGIAFITFESQEGCDAALQYDGEELEGMQLKVQRCKPARPAAEPPGRYGAVAPPQQMRAGKSSAHANHAEASLSHAAKQKSRAEPPARVDGYNVAFVGNIPWEASKETIEELFSSFEPKFVRMFDDRATGKHKGFAHVHFADASSVDRALSLDGQSVLSRKIKVMYAQPSQRTKAGSQSKKPQRKPREPNTPATDAHADLLDAG